MTGEPSNLPEKLDDIYLEVNRNKISEALHNAKFEIEFAREGIKSLKMQPALPVQYRQVYEKIDDLLKCVGDLTKSTDLDIAEINSDQEMISERPMLYEDDTLIPPEIIGAIRQTIEEINAVETRLILDCEATKATFEEHDKSGLNFWAMSFEYKFEVLLNSHPARDFYENCCSGEEPIWIPLPEYTPSFLLKEFERHNWNIFKHCTGHPLQSSHHGDLVHSIVDRSPIPWELLHHIKEIRVTLEFKDIETAWERQPVASGH